MTVVDADVDEPGGRKHRPILIAGDRAGYAVCPRGQIGPQGCVDSATGLPKDRAQISRPERASIR